MTTTLEPDLLTTDGPTAHSGRAGRSADPTIRQRVRRNWVLLAAALAVVLGAILVALGSGSRGGDLDPRSYTPPGSHAIAVLLEQRGVRVVTDTDATAALQRAVAGTTLFVVNPFLLTTDQLQAVASSHADVVIADAEVDELQAMALPLAEKLSDGLTVREPACTLPAATVAGSVQLGGSGYSVPDGGQGCYPDADGYALVTFENAGHRITLLSDGTPFMNSALAKDGNAALALGLLDTHPDVEWLVPALVAPQSSGKPTSLEDLLPDRLKLAVLQLIIAVIVIALWRGRRLGRLVPEELPVVVRQSETVRGRSRLYRRSRSLDRAAEALREGTRHRLTQRLGLGPRPAQPALVQAVAAHAGQPAVHIDALLYGSTPTDDRALVTLAQALTTLEQEVLRT
jgi:Domain of unknown function (DUF4350)